MELEKLRFLGNFHHNIQVLETQCGELIVLRCPTESEVISPEDFQPCTHCYGFFGGTMSFGGTIRLVPLERQRMVRKIKVKNTNTKIYNKCNISTTTVTSSTTSSAESSNAIKSLEN